MDANTLSTVISIFLLLMTGYGAKRTGVLKSSDSSIINTLVIYFTMPALIFVSIHGKVLTHSMIKIPFILMGLEFITMALAYAAARAMKLDRRTTGALILVAAFGNTAFLGYPVVTAAFDGNKQAILAAVMIDQFGMWIVLGTVGAAVTASFSGSQFEWSSVVDFIKTPLLPATALAMIFRTSDIPPLIMNTLSYLAAGTIPLAMISIGLNLSAGSVRRYPGAVIVALVMKMILMPVLMYIMLPMIGVSGTVQKVAILQSAMPAAAFTGVISARFGANGAFAAATILVTTLASILLIPCLLSMI